jgi:hypothetical protein
MKLITRLFASLPMVHLLFGIFVSDVQFHFVVCYLFNVLHSLARFELKHFGFSV